MRRLICAAIAALTLAGQAPAQQSIVLTPDQLRNAALAALDAGDLAQAAQYARALVFRDPADAVARGILAQVALAAGDPAAARAQGAALWRSASDNAQRYDGARLAAYGAMQGGNLMLAQLWLRRALAVAPDPASAQQTAQDFRAVRDRNPLSLSFGLSVSPSDNVTGGTTVDVIRVDGEPVRLVDGNGQVILPYIAPSPIDRAYGGWSYAPSLSLTYRLQADDRAQTRIWASGQYRGVLLSDAALAQLDRYDLGNQDFSQGQIMAGIDRQMMLGNGSLTLSANLGRTWSRSAQSEDALGIGISRVLELDPAHALIFGLDHEWRLDAQASGDDQTRTTLRFGQITMMGDTRLRLDLSFSDARSDDYQKDYDRATAGLALTPPDPLPGVRLEARLTGAWTSFPTYRFFADIPGGRTDRQLALDVDVTLDRFSWAGFSPTVSLQAERTLSNVNQFESGGVTVNFGFRSTF